MRLRCSNRWRLAVVACVVLASPIPLGSVASAGALSTLHANPQQVQPGGTITLFGRNYSSNPAASNIEIRLDGRRGPVIASFSPRSMIGHASNMLGEPINNAGEPITIPVGTSFGSHILVATQFTTQGNMISGGPGRTTIEVTVSRSAQSVTAPGAPAPFEPVASQAPVGMEWLAALARDRPALILAVGLPLLALVLAMRYSRRAPGRLAPFRHAT